MHIRISILKRALSVSVAVFLAVIIDHYYSVLHEYWVPLATFLVMQSFRRSNLRMLLLRFLFVTLFFFAGSSLFDLLHGSSSEFYGRIHDVVLGGVIAVLCSLVIFPQRADTDFREGVVPVLQAYQNYLTAIICLLFNPERAGSEAESNKIQVEKALQSDQTFFPDWVYEAGFSLALQSGHRHFLVRVEQLGQVLFKMHAVARHAIDKQLLDELKDAVLQSVEVIHKNISAIIAVLNLKKPENPTSDLQDEMSVLENAFKKAVPLPLELLDMSQDNVHVAALVYDLKDLQKILLKLSEALK